MPFNKTLLSAGMATLCLMGAQAPAWAEDLSDRIEFHGFGYQAYLQTSKNPYLGADSKGSWDDNALEFIATARLSEKSKLWAMIDADADGVRLGWLSVDYQFSNDLIGKAGQSKEPWAGTTKPSMRAFCNFPPCFRSCITMQPVFAMKYIEG